LVPPAIRSLRAHLADGNPEAWRAALRVFEHAFGRTQEQATPTEDLTLPTSAWDVQNLTWTQLQMMPARVLGELPTGETEIEATNVGPVVVADGTMVAAGGEGGRSCDIVLFEQLSSCVRAACLRVWGLGVRGRRA